MCVLLSFPFYDNFLHFSFSDDLGCLEMFGGPRDGPHLLRQRRHGRVQLGASGGRGRAAAGAGAATGAREAAGQVVRGRHVTKELQKYELKITEIRKSKPHKSENGTLW